MQILVILAAVDYLTAVSTYMSDIVFRIASKIIRKSMLGEMLKIKV